MKTRENKQFASENCGSCLARVTTNPNRPPNPLLLSFAGDHRRRRNSGEPISKEESPLRLIVFGVVLGIPWDVDTEGLREYMGKFGPLDDCVVMKERSSGRSRGFGYVTFSSADDAKNVLECEHVLGNRTLEVKIATPKEEMKPQGSKKATRIFVARIPQSVDESMFRGHFESFGEITDLYMPKEHGSKGHRGIGFITFQSAESVDSIMQESHELDGTTVVVDRATPKDEDARYPPSRTSQGGYGAYNAYISAATRYAALGAPTLYDHPGSAYGRGGYYGSSQGMGNKKIFVGRLPQDANTEDLRHYFGRFGRIVDAYIPKDPKRSGHRGFGFVTFADEGVADRVARRSHEILGQEVAIDTAAPLEGDSGGGYMEPMDLYGAYGSMRTYGRFCGGLDYDGMAGSEKDEEEVEEKEAREENEEKDVEETNAERGSRGMDIAIRSRSGNGIAAMDGRMDGLARGVDAFLRREMVARIAMAARCSSEGQRGERFKTTTSARAGKKMKTRENKQFASENCGSCLARVTTNPNRPPNPLLLSFAGDHRRRRNSGEPISKEESPLRLIVFGVVLGIPWDVDTEGLREYMGKFGPLDDCVVMKERSSGRSRGFGYVTFSSADDAKNVLECEHVLGNRTLEVKIATPKEEMKPQGSKKATRIFVARIPQSVDESMFQSVDSIMQESHELDGTTVVVDRATPKDEDARYPPSRTSQGGYGAYNAYISAATRYAALGAPTLYDHPGSAYGRGGYYGSSQGMGNKKIFVGRLPQDANTEDLRHYFGRFGRIVDAYIPKDPKRSGHRGFGFVTFADEGVADRVARRSHEILGQEVAIDTAAPLEGDSGGGYMEPMDLYGAYGSMRTYGRFCGGLDYDVSAQMCYNVHDAC
uniref:RRM domain-containing protein n=1 Tax=Leersia perrieri TaxID=77586 RepID=A0A0D9VA57_9ORYZ